MTVRLAGKVIIVTGSTTGIGKAIAQACVREGARVIIHGLEADWGAEVVALLGAEHAALHIEDIAEPGCAERLVNVALTKFGRLDGVVNNAAAVVSSSLETTDLAFFRRVLEINTLAPFSLIKAALPHLRQVRGCVLNIGSVNAYSGE
ncbi:MAG TPA: SDR family NAD(P)-dependent oxidoreductase, partial [Chryseolinea sp.]|nr:SDR family NAD(P)-dependent oxidoreductase [Chryseolinea sp.]